MTVTKPESAGSAPPPVETVNATIDGIPITVPKGTLIIRAAEQLGIQIPRFCDHPLLDPLGACRQCIVEVEGQRKPLTACTSTVTDGMVILSQLTSQVAEKAQKGTIEFLLLNHPLDCPVCDKGGECPLQNQSLANGAAESRFTDVKRTFPKPIAISSQVLLDRERCVLCARCTRFSQQIAGDPFIELFERGALEQVGIYEDEPFSSYFSGNTVQICPVGALTGAQYRFRARPFDLVSTPSVCEHCASGCQQRTDWRRGKVLRRLAGADDDVNEEWNCDKGRWAFQYATARDRITTPMVRDDDGYLIEASWTEALERAAAGLREYRGRTGVLTGGRLTVEDAYAYSKFARVALGSNDIDFRARPHSAEEQDFLASSVAGRYLETTYADLEKAPAVLLAGFEPEEESPIVFLRLRKAAATHRTSVFGIAPFATDGLRKLRGSLLQAAPGTEAEVLGALVADDDRLDDTGTAAVQALRATGAVICVGERLAAVPGALSAAARLAETTGARLAWIPRRAGDRGALEAGCLPALLPGGRPLADSAARNQVAEAWGCDVPLSPGRDGDTQLNAAAAGSLALVIAGVDPADLADPDLAMRALGEAPFVVSLEIRESVVTDRADVVLPVAPVVAKSGSFLDWEGRLRPFDATLESAGALADQRVLHRLAAEMGIDLGLPSVRAAQEEIARLGAWNGQRPAAPATKPADPPRPAAGEAVLATWHHLLDDGRLQEHEPHLAGTRRPTVLRLSAATAAGLGVADGAEVTVATDLGSITLPLAITDLPEHVVWVPTNSQGSHVHASLGVGSGAVVRISAGEGERAVIAPMAVNDNPVFGLDPWWLILLKVVIIFVFLVVTTLLMIWAERRVIGRMQARLGPNRVGPFGVGQGLADGIKLALKEDLIPAMVDKPLYILAPIVACAPAFLSFGVIPIGPEVSIFGHHTPLQITDLPVAVLFILAMASIGVYGIVLAGWSSQSPYPLLGALRSAAQVISYEVAMGLALAAVFLYAGSLSTSDIVAAQHKLWYIIPLAPSFVFYLISMVGETNRAPFDLPEAESELVAGFHTEYASLKFALFFLAEYINVTTVSALATTLFLGGWRAPWPLSLVGNDMLNHGWWPILWFAGKLFVLLFGFIWLRGTLPRLRYDQFMRLGWKVLIPFSLIWILVVASFRELTNEGRSRLQSVGFVGIPIAVVVLVWSFVAENRAAARDREIAELEAAPDEIVTAGGVRRASYPIPVLTGAPTLDVVAVSTSEETMDTEVPNG